LKILIIGSEGFIGNHCVSFYLKKGCKVFGCDILDYKTLNYDYFKISRLSPNYDEIFINKKYDLCINASGNGNVQVSVNHPLKDFEANCSDVIILLEKLRIYSPDCKYIHLSSAAVYGNPTNLPISEESVLNPISPYGWHKLISEKICKEYATLYKMKVAILRPFSVYGPKLRKQLFWDIYQKIKNNSKQIEVFGSGMESRDFIYIEDLIIAIDLIFEKSELNGDIYNLANGEEVFIKDAVNDFVNIYNDETRINFSNNKLAGSPVNWLADISKIKKLGYQPKHNFTDNIKSLVSWMKDLR